MDKKMTNKPLENVLYLSEEDARALGIVEGETQSIYVDGKNVPLTFIDEHELFEASEEEIRILNKALDLRQRELEAKFGMGADSEANYYRAIEGQPNYDSQSLVPYKKSSKYPRYDDEEQNAPLNSGRNIFGAIKTFFNTNNKLKTSSLHEPEDKLEKNKYRNRTDIFTNEEIEIIQEVIARAQANQNRQPSVKTRSHLKTPSYEEEQVSPTHYQYVVEKPVYSSALTKKVNKPKRKKAKVVQQKKKVISVDEGTEVELIVKNKNKPVLKKTIDTNLTPTIVTTAKPEKIEKVERIVLANKVSDKNALKSMANSKTGHRREVVSARKKQARKQARRQARLDNK